MQPNTIKPAKGSKRKSKRVGRGNASGKGNYSARGMKGQRSRSGGKGGLKLRGMKARLQKIPKLRGFKSPNEKAEEVNLSILDKNFKDGDKVSLKRLKKLGLIENNGRGVKILANGDTKKNLLFKIVKFLLLLKLRLKQLVERCYNRPQCFGHIKIFILCGVS